MDTKQIITIIEKAVDNRILEFIHFACLDDKIENIYPRLRWAYRAFLANEENRKEILNDGSCEFKPNFPTVSLDKIVYSKVEEPKKKISKKEETHTCQYVKTSGVKQGQTCGKPAKNQFDEKWYCGTVKSDGTSTCCIKQIKLDKIEKLDKSPVKKENLVQKSVFPHKIKLEQIGNYMVDTIHRIAIDKNHHQALGVLNKDNKTLSKLNQEQIKYVEGKGIIVKEDIEENDLSDEEIESKENSVIETESEDEEL